MTAERKTQPRLDSTGHECTQEDRIRIIEIGMNSVTGVVLVANNNLDTLLEDTAGIKNALRGSNGEIGIVGRLSKVEDAVSDIKRLMWIVLGVVITLAAGGLWGLLMESTNTIK
jgi:hypothetical protein